MIVFNPDVIAWKKNIASITLPDPFTLDTNHSSEEKVTLRVWVVKHEEFSLQFLESLQMVQVNSCVRVFLHIKDSFSCEEVA